MLWVRASPSRKLNYALTRLLGELASGELANKSYSDLIQHQFEYSTRNFFIGIYFSSEQNTLKRRQ